MDLRCLNTFVQVAELGSFSRAGEKLGYSQPTVSVHIRQLEEELEVRLFDRIGHSVRLTDKGREVLVHAQHVCQSCREMEVAAGKSSHVSGTIRIATAQSLCQRLMMKSYGAFRKRYPEMKIELTTGDPGELFRLLDHNEADIVCTLDSHIYNSNYIIAWEEKIGVHLVAAADHPLAKQNVITKEVLLSQELLLTEKNMSYRRLLDDFLAKDSLAVEPMRENGDADLLCLLVCQGLGISFLPDYVTEEAVRQGKIVRLDLDGFHPELWKQLLYRRDKWVSPPMQAALTELSKITDKPDSQNEM